MKHFRTYQLSIKLYHACQKFKVSRHLRDQLDRSSSSVVLNLAEGRGKRTTKDQRKYFDISMGSLRETQAILELTMCNSEIVDLADHTVASLYKLLKNLNDYPS